MQSIISARPITLNNAQESQLPRLSQLRQDFSFCISQVMSSDSLVPSFALFHYCHMSTDSNNDKLLTPLMGTLKELEEHVSQHIDSLIMAYFDEEPLAIAV